MIETRWSNPEDATALARVHEAAWRFAYGGVIPGLTLERMVAAHGRDWWRTLHADGGRALVIALDGEVMGYATIGRCRNRRFIGAGEIYELYLDPVCHGAGLGRRLFDEARRRLDARALKGLIVWSLALNEVGCRFYRALGGRPEARSHTSLGRERLEVIAFAWS